jgi:glycosyltransferase involved in cell wall biosynthesis
LRIGLFTELFPPSFGGQEQRFADLADLLAMRGHQVTVMCVRHLPDAPEDEILSSGVEVIRRPLSPRYYKPFGGLLPRSPLGMIRYALAVRRLTRSREFDVLFLNQWPLLHVLALSRADRARAILDWCEIRGSAVFQAVQKLLPRLVAANTAVSTHVAAYLRSSSNTRALVLPSGISNHLYRMERPQDRQGLLHLGRITTHKNLPLLISMFEELQRRGYREPLTIAGDGPAIEALRRRVEVSPGHAQIRLLGAVSDKRKIELLASARVLVITSQREGFPRVVAEAMASGLPVVTACYPQNGTVSVVNEYDCGLCASPEAVDLADAAQSILAAWDAWSARAHHKTADLDWSSLSRQFERLLVETAAAQDADLPHRTRGASCE